MANRRLNQAFGITEREMERDKKCQEVEKTDLLEMYYILEMAIAIANKPSGKGRYNYIPFSHLMFFHALKDAIGKRNPKKLRYLEVGCGVGTKLYIAKHWAKIGSVSGIEVNPSYSKIAKEMLAIKLSVKSGYTGDNKVYEMCAFDFKDWDKYDIIYIYRPLDNYFRNDKLMNKIRKKKRKDAVLVEAHCFHNGNGECVSFDDLEKS